MKVRGNEGGFLRDINGGKKGKKKAGWGCRTDPIEGDSGKKSRLDFFEGCTNAKKEKW